MLATGRARLTYLNLTFVIGNGSFAVPFLGPFSLVFSKKVFWYMASCRLPVSGGSCPAGEIEVVFDATRPSVRAG